MHEYDRAGRLVGTVTTLDDTVVTTKYTYDPLGRLEMSVVTSGEVSDTTIRSYNVRGWQTDIRNKNWSAQMRYNNPVLSDSETSFTGNISEWEWTRGSETNAYSLLYDDLSRITGSRLFRNGSLTEALSEKNISYDSNGNILSLTRTGEDGLTIMDLSYGYDGNRLTSLSDDDFQSQNYAYDLDGNMTFDGRTGLSLEWNALGLVEKVRLNGEDLVNYSYLADGTKVSAIDSEGNGLLYLGSLIYRKTGNSIELESAGFAGGRFVARESSPGVSCIVPMIHVADHLGSVRTVIDGTTGSVVEINDYYPFGSRWNTAAGLKDPTNRYCYNSKEEQSSLNPSSVRSAVSYIDYGARQYDPVLARWTTPDPLAEKYYSISPYAFCNNNPVSYVDPDGMDFRKTVRGSSIVIKTTYYTNVNSLKSANQAAKFWNQRQDKYISKSGKQFTVNYKLKIQKTDNLSAFKEGVNTYEVVDAFESEGRAGATRDGRNVEVLDEYSINRPGSDAESTTGAHEIGHTLGMEHSEQGIMSRQQDESRTHEVTQDNIRQMLESERGNADILTIIINAIFKVYEQQ